MKIKSQIIGIFALTFLFFSCVKEEALTPNPNFMGNAPATPASFSAKVNGNSFNANNMTATFLADGRIIIAGLDGMQRISMLLAEQKTGVQAANASGSVFLQYNKDTSSTDLLYSTFFSSIPVGNIDITSIDRTLKTISGVFNGEVFQTSISNPFNIDSLSITSGKFNNLPYTEQTLNFNFGFMEFEAEGEVVTMNTATVDTASGINNGRIYQFYNISTGTSNFSKTIAIQLDDSRYVEGMTTNFTNDYSGPFDGVAEEDLANALYSVDLLNNGKSYESTSGSITITKIELVNGEEKVSGTFEFTGESFFGGDTISLKNGKFEAIRRS